MTSKKVEAGDFVQAFCKRCQKESKHIVVALLKGVPAKVQCTVCKGNHAYQKKSPVTQAHARIKTAAQKEESQEWLNLSAQWDASKAIPYDTNRTYKRGDLLDHKLFGLGIVRGLPGYRRMQVLFQGGEKLMQCAN